MEHYQTIILASVFVIILLVTYQGLKAAFSFGTAGTFILSVCASLLSVIGMARCLNGSLEVILLPYAAMGISILVLLVTLYFWRYPKRFKERAEMRNKNDSSKSQQIKSL